MNFFIKTMLIISLPLFYCPSAWPLQAALLLPLRQPTSTQSIAQTDTLAESNDLDLPRPRRHLGGRGEGGICIVAPGLLEQKNVIWGDRPLFLWQITSEAVAVQRLEVFDQDGKILWDKGLVATDKSAVYSGQALQPGQYYQWRLTWTVQGNANSATYTFQVMDSNRRNSITSQLQTRTHQLQATGASDEAIATQKAHDLLRQSEPLWSDALQTLYAVEAPSSATTQQIQVWVNTACGETTSLLHHKRLSSDFLSRIYYRQLPIRTYGAQK